MLTIIRAFRKSSCNLFAIVTSKIQITMIHIIMKKSQILGELPQCDRHK